MQPVETRQIVIAFASFADSQFLDYHSGRSLSPIPVSVGKRGLSPIQPRLPCISCPPTRSLNQSVAVGLFFTISATNLIFPPCRSNVRFDSRPNLLYGVSSCPQWSAMGFIPRFRAIFVCGCPAHPDLTCLSTATSSHIPEHSARLAILRK